MLDASLLLPVMKEFITQQLTEDFMAAAIGIKDTLCYVELGDVYLVDVPWFADEFPERLRMGQICAVYDLMAAHE